MVDRRNEVGSLAWADPVEDPRSSHDWSRHAKQAAAARLQDSLVMDRQVDSCSPECSSLQEAGHHSWEEEDNGNAVQ